MVQTGHKFRGDMAAKIEKWQEPPPAKTSKPLPAPDAEIKKRRGGRRLRKMKERYGLTDVSWLGVILPVIILSCVKWAHEWFFFCAEDAYGCQQHELWLSKTHKQRLAC
jgi:hypothetical protein